MIQNVFLFTNYKNELVVYCCFVKQGKPVIQKIIAMDREQTGLCHFTMASETFWPGHLHFFLPKNSSYTETINRGYKIMFYLYVTSQIINTSCCYITSILRMQETGLLGKWVATFNPEAKECLSKNNIKKTGKPQISLKNLTSAFTLLIFGICVSLLVFLVELIYRVRRFNSSL
jgi:hypothetical protein